MTNHVGVNIEPEAGLAGFCEKVQHFSAPTTDIEDTLALQQERKIDPLSITDQIFRASKDVLKTDIERVGTTSISGAVPEPLTSMLIPLDEVLRICHVRDGKQPLDQSGELGFDLRHDMRDFIEVGRGLRTERFYTHLHRL